MCLFLLANDTSMQIKSIILDQTSVSKSKVSDSISLFDVLKTQSNHLRSSDKNSTTIGDNHSSGKSLEVSLNSTKSSQVTSDSSTSEQRFDEMFANVNASHQDSPTIQNFSIYDLNSDSEMENDFGKDELPSCSETEGSSNEDESSSKLSVDFDTTLTEMNETLKTLNLSQVCLALDRSTDSRRLLDETELRNFSNYIQGDRVLRDCIEKIDVSQMLIRVQTMQADVATFRFLWSTIELNIRFGSVVRPMNKDGQDVSVNDPDRVREIISFDVISKHISGDELPQAIMDGVEDPAEYDNDHYVVPFISEEHRTVLMMAHDSILHHFNEKQPQFKQKYRTSSSLYEFLEDFDSIVSNARRLALEIHMLMEGKFVQLSPKDEESGKYRFVHSIRWWLFCVVNFFSVFQFAV